MSVIDVFTRQEKRVIGVLAVLLLLLNGAIIAWYIIKEKGSLENQTTQDGDMPDTTADEKNALPDPIVTIEIDDEGDGKATVYLNIEETATIVGAELYFRVGGTLEVNDVVCESGFSCLDPELEPATVGIVALRPPSDDFSALDGRIAVAQLRYSPTTSGLLIMNAAEIESSIVSSMETENNLLSEEEQVFTIGEIE